VECVLGEDTAAVEAEGRGVEDLGVADVRGGVNGRIEVGAAVFGAA
jgi:hypothetical protein